MPAKGSSIVDKFWNGLVDHEKAEFKKMIEWHGATYTANHYKTTTYVAGEVKRNEGFVYNQFQLNKRKTQELTVHFDAQRVKKR